jgi:histidinol-phosphatase (PHP family)
MNLPRRDGHTHTEVCLHGSKEPTEQFIERAIDLGFETYSLTEHPPLPEGFEDPTPDKTCGMLRADLGSYFEMAQRLKKKYAGQINIRVGLEVDYVPGFEAETRALLAEVGPDLQDGLLSIHFLKGKGGWRCVDYSPEDFAEGLLSVYGSVEAIHKTYWSTVKQAILADLGPYKPTRLSHLSLIHKFQLRYSLKNPRQFAPEILEILDLIQSRSLELDLNAAGLFKPDCREIYPAPWIVAEALKRDIRFVYGSDTHSVKGVGQGFDKAQEILSAPGKF